MRFRLATYITHPHRLCSSRWHHRTLAARALTMYSRQHAWSAPLTFDKPRACAPTQVVTSSMSSTSIAPKSIAAETGFAHPPNFRASAFSTRYYLAPRRRAHVHAFRRGLARSATRAPAFTACADAAPTAAAYPLTARASASAGLLGLTAIRRRLPPLPPPPPPPPPTVHGLGYSCTIAHCPRTTSFGTAAICSVSRARRPHALRRRFHRSPPDKAQSPRLPPPPLQSLPHARGHGPRQPLEWWAIGHSRQTQSTKWETPSSTGYCATRRGRWTHRRRTSFCCPSSACSYRTHTTCASRA